MDGKASLKSFLPYHSAGDSDATWLRDRDCHRVLTCLSLLPQQPRGWAAAPIAHPRHALAAPRSVSFANTGMLLLTSKHTP